MLTGEYAWRKPGTGILPGNAALIIEPGRTTLAAVFQRAGYATGVVGKWHLGLGPDGGPNWNGEIRPGPTDIGFDSAFIMAATGDRVPTVYVENRRVVGLDPADPITVSYGQPFGDLPTGRGQPGSAQGASQPRPRPDHRQRHQPNRIHDGRQGRALERRGHGRRLHRQGDRLHRAARGQPFFLYFAPHDPHVPRVPHPRFAGATRMGPRGDAIAQLDWSVGEVLATLDRLKLADDTLVLFTSDNSRGGFEARRRRLPREAVRNGGAARTNRGAATSLRLLRFADGQPSAESHRFGDIAIDFRSAEVTKGGEPLELSAREFKLLRYFIEHRGAALARDELLNEVWGYNAMPSTRTVDVHVAWLRQKIEDNPAIRTYILTVHGLGYKFAG